MTSVSIGHSWNAHGISGFEVEAPGVGEGDFDGILGTTGEAGFDGWAFCSGGRLRWGVEFGITEDSEILRSLVLVTADVLDWV